MNHSRWLLLAAFLSLAGSWFGFVLTPQAQLGRLQPANLLGEPTLYPHARPGLARQGLEVYRANGCAECHTQQVRQSGTVCDVLLSAQGTNQAAVLSAVVQLKPGWSRPEARQWLSTLPRPLLEGLNPAAAAVAVKALNAAGAQAAVGIRPVGPEIARGWGKRRNVARDFLFDSPAALGSQRIGPDLADVGARQPDARWHLRHLYAPGLEVGGSAMPPYRFLFEQRRIVWRPSPDALTLPPGLAPPRGYEVVPKPEAAALAAYLLSLRTDAPLFEAPLSVAAARPEATSTNAPPTNSPAKSNSPSR